MRFVAVGDVLVDVVCAAVPRAGQRIHSSVSLQPGGSAVNAAVCAARLGADATVVGRIGSDPAADIVESFLTQQNVATCLARDQELRTGIAVVLVEQDATCIVADRGANARFSSEDVPDPLEADVLLVSGFALLQPGSDAAARTALDRFDGRLAAVDLASPKLAARPDLGKMTRGVQVVFATEAEARAVTEASPEEAARALASRYPIACVKLGREGALAARGDVIERSAAPPVVPTVALGAGDAFAAAFLLALLADEPLRGALEAACEAGAAAVSARAI
jgi:sugar/nucleoside kinase (ribokinase family)